MNDCQQHWAAIDNKSREEGNRPEDYLNKNTAIIEVLVSQWDIPKDASILELGTNVGTNLNKLMYLGYTNLAGVEINPHALSLQRECYPKLNGLIAQSSIEDFVTTCKEQYDCVFSMAVLMHVPHESDFIYSEIARIAKNTVVVIEHELEDMEFIYSRNYKTMFESLGFKEVYSKFLNNTDNPSLLNYNDYVYRVFKRNG